MRGTGVLLSLVVISSAFADERHDAEARALYREGEKAFGGGDYQTAYEDFRRAYFLSQRPALLFNMASAAKELNRPVDFPFQSTQRPYAIDVADFDQDGWLDFVVTTRFGAEAAVVVMNTTH